MKNLFFIFILVFFIFSSCKKDEPLNTSPHADFKIIPENPEVFYEVFFDASESFDKESALKYRWDIDGDGKFESPYSESAFYQTYYSLPGNYFIMLEVMDDQGWTSRANKFLKVVPKNSLVAKLIINPQQGSTETIFFFDSSDSYDSLNPQTNLKVRWDWEGDSIWDTGFFEEKTAYHRYVVPGIYYPSVEVKNSLGQTSTARDTLKIN